MGKTDFFSGNCIAACDLKVDGCIELNDLMKPREYRRSRSFFDLRQRSLGFQT